MKSLTLLILALIVLGIAPYASAQQFVNKTAGAPCTINSNCTSLRCRGGFCCAFDNTAKWPTVEYFGRQMCTVCAEGTGICTNCSTSSPSYFPTYNASECASRFDGGYLCSFDDECHYYSKANKCYGGRCCGTNQRSSSSKCTVCGGSDGRCTECEPGFTPSSTTYYAAYCIDSYSSGSACTRDSDCKSNRCRRDPSWSIYSPKMICCGAVVDKCDVCSKSTGTCLNCTTNYNLVGDACVYVDPTPSPTTPAPTPVSVASDAGSACTANANCTSGRCRGGYCCAYDDGSGLSSEITSGRAKCIVCAAVTGMCANCSLTYSDNYRLTRDTRECKQRLQPGSSCTFDDECAPSSPYASKRYTRCLTGKCCSTWDQDCRACSEIDGACLSCMPQARLVVSYSNLASCAARRSDGSCTTDRDCASNMCRRSTEPRDPYVGWKQACCAPNVDPNCFVCSNIDGKCANCTTNYELVGDKCVHIATPAPTPVPVAGDAGNACTKNEGCATGRCRGGFCCAYDDGTLAKYNDEPLMRGRVQCIACATGTGLCTSCTPHNFVTNKASECARELGAGRECSADRDCESGACRGGFCCYKHIAITNCSVCTSTGFCSNCTVGCTDCDEPVGMCDACAAGYQLQNWTCTGTGASSPSPSGQADTTSPAPVAGAPPSTTVQPTASSPASITKPAPATTLPPFPSNSSQNMTPATATSPAPVAGAPPSTTAQPTASSSPPPEWTFHFSDSAPYDENKVRRELRNLLHPGIDVVGKYTLVPSNDGKSVTVRFDGDDSEGLSAALSSLVEQNEAALLDAFGAASVTSPASSHRPQPIGQSQGAGTTVSSGGDALKPKAANAVAAVVVLAVAVSVSVGAVLLYKRFKARRWDSGATEKNQSPLGGVDRPDRRNSPHAL